MARTIEQLENNLGASGWALDSAQLAQLDQASAPPLPYPYEMIERTRRE